MDRILKLEMRLAKGVKLTKRVDLSGEGYDTANIVKAFTNLDKILEQVFKTDQKNADI